MIPQSFIQELLSRVDIVDVVERYVKLKKAGANYVACCPFHSEKTPSFSVSPSKQFYHCFGCGAHGSAIGFVMAYAGLGFVDAVHELASTAGMPVPVQRREDQARKSEDRVSLTDVMARAARYYREQLKRSPRAIAYLKGRGLTGEIAARFGIGYAPDGWQNLEQAFPDYRAPQLLEAGLVVDNEQGRRYDRFRDRVMFPIVDGRGNVIGFGGRVIDAEKAADGTPAGPKYLNSPETPLFEKGRELYGLPQARDSIRAHDTVIVVEGYMDVVALAQHGVGGAVATLGTATTGNHVHKLLRHANRVVFCFDGDAAGRKAAWRALEASLEHIADNKSVAFLFLPPEHDPDSFVRAQGADAFRRLAGQAVPLSDFLLRELRSRGDMGSVEGRSRVLYEAKPLLGRIHAPMLRLQLTRALAEATRVTPAEVESLCELKPLSRAAPAVRTVPRRAPPTISRTLLKIVLQKPGWAPSLPLEQLPDDAEGAALQALCDAVDHGELPAGGIGTVIEYFRAGPHEPLFDEIVAELAAENFDEAAMETVFNDALEQLRRGGLTREIAALNAKERSGGLSPDERQRLMQLLAQKQRLSASASATEL
ncbi:MAG: primase [Proteobacteria bacterium]|nr:primase [Pseudomonadota bacterium]